MKVGMKRILTLLLAVLLVIPQVPLRSYGAEENPAEAGQMVTVTFAVEEEAYTRDPGSGQTHITVDEPITGGELVYTDWAGRYKVTGTGTLCSFTIPAGTTLAQGGFSLPKLTVANIGTENAATYISSYSWVTDQGMVCNANTVFNQDTTLSLSLYTDSDNHSLNFVCGGGSCSGNHSIPYVLGGYPSATFSLGQSVSAPYIPTKEDIDANYSSQWCSHGKDHGETFVKWQLKNTATGEMVDFTAGTPITADYVENDSHSIRVYAVWGGEPVTATFRNGDTVVHTAQIPAGTALGELPSVTPPEGQRFQGWQYTDENGEPRFATSQTVIAQDTIFTAVFVPVETVTVQVQDIRFDGETAETLELSGEKGQTLEALFQDKAFADGTALSGCVWYAVSEDGTKTKVQKDTVVDGAMRLYTYSYQLVLKLSAAEAAALRSVVVDKDGDGGLTLTVTAREGQPLAASDFVADGVDYTTYAWSTADGQPVNIQNLIANGLTENVTSTGTRQTTAQMSIKFYVAVDGRWILLTHQEMEVYQPEEGRYYITAGQLESVYGEYGFCAEQLKAGTKYFPHTTRDDATIWADASVVIKDGIAYSPLLRAENVYQCDVYYLPNQSCTDSGSWSSYLSSDSFYSVTVLDPEGRVYQPGELPPVTYHVKDSQAMVTVKAPENVQWQCIGDDGTQIGEGVDNGDGTVTFTIPQISQPYTLTPSQPGAEVHKIVYHVNVTEPPKDPDYGRPTIQGGETYRALETGAAHNVLAPSMTVYFYESDSKYLGEATFRGWLINDTQELIQPGEELNLDQYDTTIHLTAKWEFSIGGTDPNEGAVNLSSMVNFFVALKAAPEGSVSWGGNIQASAFTDSVFTADCGVTGEEAVDNNLYSGNPVQVGGIKQYFVLGATGGNNLNALHNQVVTRLTNGYQKEGNNHQNYTFQLDFPTDEQVLRQVRSMVADGTVISLNGKTVAVEDLNADNFTVKWHVFKFDDSDGWHVDGVLVAKVGTMRITKTFAGDAEAIQAVKNGFQIQVEAVENEFDPPHPGATLTIADASFNPATGTYTWEIPVDQYRDYTVTEKNYIPDDDTIETSARYMVNGSKYMEQNTDGWVAFAGTAVTVTGQTGEQNRVQTVSFLNTYTKPGVITLKKVDAFTGTLMANVSFTIEKNGHPLPLYRLEDGSYTIENGEGGESVSGITTDINGQVFLYLGTGTFTFRENVPAGYDDPGAITVVVDENGTITQAFAENDNEDLNRKFARINTSTEIQVNNYSKTVPVTVHKNWTDGENREVVLQLYCNGQSMGVQNFSKTLNGSTDNWTHTFTLTVPLYIDGQPAQYSLLETRIGDWLYSQEYSGDGYRYYDVSYSPAVYRDGEGQTTDVANAQEIYLEVSNRRTTGQLIVRKTDENNRPLGGAEFYLYQAPAENPGYLTVTKDADGHNVLEGPELVKRVTSAASGETAFGSIPAGNYYLIEHAAPQFYQGTDTVYLVEVSGTESVMKRWQDDQWVAVGNTTIVNTRQVIPVTIDKTVDGNMGDRSKSFEFTVTSDLPMEAGTGYTLSVDKLTATFRLAHGQNITLNVRRGATLRITEDNARGYTMTLTLDDNPVEGNSVTIPGDAVHTFVHVRNTKNLEVDTGVILDSLPYVLLLSTAGCGSLLLAGGRKRRKKQ